MMRVHVKIALAGDIKIKKAVLCKSLQHMIKKTDSGMYVMVSATIEYELKAYIRFICLSADL